MQLTKDAYTFNEAAELLHYSKQQLIQYQRQDLLHTITIDSPYSNRKIAGITKQEVNRLNQVLNQNPKGTLTIAEFVMKTGIKYHQVYQLIRQFKIKSVPNPSIPLHTKFYKIEDLKKIENYQKKRLQQNTKLEKELTPNTHEPYDATKHYQLKQIIAKLKIPYTVGLQWVRYHRIKYNVDDNHKLYFTKQQFNLVIHNYKNRPADAIYTKKDLCNAFNVSEQRISHLANRNGINAIKVLGMHKAFYNKQQYQALKKILKK